MKIVADTNVIVSGLLYSGGPPGHIVRLIAHGKLFLGYDGRILREYETVFLRPKFSFSPDAVEKLITQIKADGWLAPPLTVSVRLPDPTDEPFLQVALAGGAEALVTGNLRHFPAGACRGLKVLSPKQFLERFLVGIVERIRALTAPA